MAAWPAHAAIAVVQTVSCEAQGATTCNAGPITTTNGNLFIASTGYCCDTFTSITDNKSNVYADSITETGSGLAKGRQQFKAAGSGGASHTFTITGAGTSFFATLSVQEVSGADSSPLDQTKAAEDSVQTNHTTGATSATAQADELLIGFGTTITFVTYTTDTGAGWTEQTNIATDIDSEGLVTGSRVVSAIGTYAYTYVTSAGANGVQGISTWKASAVAANRQRCIGCGTDKKVIGE